MEHINTLVGKVQSLLMWRKVVDVIDKQTEMSALAIID
jgi:hypothetical protein